MPEAAKHPSQDNPNFKPKLYGIAALVTVLILSGLWLVSRYTESDFKRDQATWYEKLNLIAESRASDVNKWVADHFNELRLLADNPSLRVYMTEIQMSQDSTPQQAVPEPAAAQSSLRSLLLFSAERTGFISRSNMSSIPANVTPETVNGLAIFNNKNQIVVSTILSNEARELMTQHVSKLAGQEGFIDIFKAKDNQPYMGFIVPIYSIQGDRGPNSQIGHIVGIIPASDAFFSLLKHPGVTEQTLETILVRKTANNRLQYLSPLQDGSKPLGKETAMDAGKFSEVKLVNEVGSFTTLQKDYRDKPILGISRAITGTPWVMIVKIDRPEAYSSGNDRRISMMTFFLLMIAFIIMVIVAIWWYAHSKRALFMSSYFRKLLTQSQSQEMLLKLVTDYQPESIMIVDTSNNIHFANLQAAVDSNLSPGTLEGKALKDVVGKDRAVQIGGQCMQALEDNSVGYDIYRLPNNDGGERVVRSAFVPLKYIPVPSLSKKIPGVLVVDQDITEVVHEREARTKTSQQLVNMMVQLVDKRDPFSANHSQLVSKVAYEVAISVALDQSMVETTETAARLMNIGKIVVPSELLTKTGNLTEAEKATIRDSMIVAADMMHGISFDGPVEETLRQWQERWDGKGPLGLKHESILVSARIIAVANAFVGMISPRAWRDAIPVDQANKFLLEDSDKAFDRRIVIALINYVENHSGREWLTKMMIDSSDIKKAAR